MTRSLKPTTTAPDAKEAQLASYREDPTGNFLTTDQGVRVVSTDDSLHAGERGPTLMEDFHLREKIMRFDHERIPERVVHARGAGAHGHFQVYQSLAKYTSAGFLQDPEKRTPVFVRFSTVVGSRGSADTVRDVRGFAVKFYTEQGNFDLVGNNMPVFFIQDGIKFPDLIHAVKPNPRKEIPQAQSAHDSFWDFISLTPETAHMVMWVMSDRSIPRSYRMMEGFGVHTFRLIDAQGMARLVKFHWRPVLGAHSLVWEEAQQIAGKDPDFHRRDLWDAIESGNPVEFELGLQVVAEADALSYGFDMLDPTKLLPEEAVPVEIVGKMTLDRNPSSFFAEVEQVAFCVGNVIPGIDFTNDPLLQARLFSYLDTQITRLGGPNFAELPINRPIAPVHNNQHDGFGRHALNEGSANYSPNSLGGGFPKSATPAQGGFSHYSERIAGHVIRARSASFQDHFSQARLFLDSQSPVERTHLTDALAFELGKCDREEVRQRVIDVILTPIDRVLATEVAKAIGLIPGKVHEKSLPNSEDKPLQPSPALSISNVRNPSVVTRKVAVMIAAGHDAKSLATEKSSLEKAGATVEIISTVVGSVTASDGSATQSARSFLNTPSVVYDGIIIADGLASVKILSGRGDALRFVEEAYRHCKTIGAHGNGQHLLDEAGIMAGDDGIVTGTVGTAVMKGYIAALSQHRHWMREKNQA